MSSLTTAPAFVITAFWELVGGEPVDQLDPRLQLPVVFIQLSFCASATHWNPASASSTATTRAKINRIFIGPPQEPKRESSQAADLLRARVQNGLACSELSAIPTKCERRMSR